LGRLGAFGERLLRDLYELVGLVAVGVEPDAVGDDGVAVRVHARILPGQKAHVASQLAREYVVNVEERRGRVDGPRLQRAELGIGVDVDPGHRGRIDPDLLGQGRPHRARAVARRIADLLPGEILDVADAGTLEPIESLRRIGIDVHHAHGVDTLAA